MGRPVDVKAHFFFLLCFQSVPIQLSRPCRHPSIRTFCERYSLGARWVFSFSRCCYLIIDLSSYLWVGVGPQELIAVTWTRRSSSAVWIPSLFFPFFLFSFFPSFFCSFSFSCLSQ